MSDYRPGYRPRPGCRPAQQLQGLLAYETEYEAAMQDKDTPLPAPSPHTAISAPTYTLLTHGLVELDPKDHMALTVRLTKWGRLSAQELNQLSLT